MLEELDIGVGRLLDELDALGISDKTYVVFTTDNGGRGTVPGGDPKSPAPNVPLSGAKHSLLTGDACSHLPYPRCGRGAGIAPARQSKHDTCLALVGGAAEPESQRRSEGPSYRY